MGPASPSIIFPFYGSDHAYNVTRTAITTSCLPSTEYVIGALFTGPVDFGAPQRFPGRGLASGHPCHPHAIRVRAHPEKLPENAAEVCAAAAQDGPIVPAVL